MKYTTTTLLFVDSATTEDAAVGVRYGHPGGAGVVLYLEEHWDIEAAIPLEHARTLLDALRTAVESVSQEPKPTPTMAADLAFTDEISGGRARTTVRYGGALVTVGLDLEPEANLELSEITMGQEEAAALVFTLEAAIRWVSQYGTPG